MISPLPGVTAAKPGSAMTPLPGISARIVDDDGNQLEPGTDHGEQPSGYLVLDKPWPSMLRGIWGDPERYQETYWSRFAEQGWYFAGDGARYDADGNIWVMGRIDDVMNVSGHRISTAEVESALVGHSGVAEAAVVGATDDTTGQAICAFVILSSADAPDTDEHMVDELRKQVATEISPIARPREIHVVPELPEDPQRQDHAAAAARRRRGPRTRRHLDAGRPQRLRGDPRQQVERYAPIGTKPEPGRFFAVMSARIELIDIVTAGVCSGMYCVTHVGRSSLKAPWIIPTNWLSTVTGAPESPGCPHT